MISRQFFDDFTRKSAAPFHLVQRTGFDAPRRDLAQPSFQQIY
jgi:hypothetical protein